MQFSSEWQIGKILLSLSNQLLINQSQFYIPSRCKEFHYLVILRIYISCDFLHQILICIILNVFLPITAKDNDQWNFSQSWKPMWFLYSRNRDVNVYPFEEQSFAKYGGCGDILSGTLLFGLNILGIKSSINCQSV